MNDSEEQLVRHSQGGDREAFEELVRRTARLVFSRVYLEAGDVHRAEDMVQETFLVAWRSIRQVTDPAGFRTWLFAVARSVTLDALRRESRRKRAAPGRMRAVPTELGDRRPGPAETAENQEQRGQVLAVLRSLPEEYRLPITLRYLAGADYDTIGKQLGLSNGSLRGLLARGMARLRAALVADDP